MERIFTEGLAFVDEQGRQRIFNGFNLSDKGRPNEDKSRKIYDLDFDEDTIVRLKNSGFNLFRIGLTWDAVEPNPGEYDEEYLQKLDKLTALCEKHGVYYFLDMHQDLYGGAVDTPADGAPFWACITDGAEFHKPKFVWAEGYFFGKAIHRCFDHFWANDICCGRPIQDWYCDMWKHVADRYKDSPALFGYDIMNEPFPGTSGGLVFRKLIASAVRAGLVDSRVNRVQLVKDALKTETMHKVLDQFADADLFHSIVCKAGYELIRKFDLNSYSPFINKVASSIREVTDKGIIIMENCYYSNLGIPCSTPPVTVNGKREKNLCFAPHGYDFMVDTPDYKYASNTRTGSIFDEHRNTQLRLNVPVFVGEWGGSGGNEGKEWLNHINFLLDKFDSYSWGQTYWCYSKGIFDTVIMESILRIAPIAVNGEIVRYGIDRENNIFSLEYIQSEDNSLATEIYLPDVNCSVTCDGECKIIKYDGSNSGVLRIKSNAGKHIVTVKA